jgi:hypothetical protein
VPQITSKNKNRIKMLNIEGSEFRMVLTRPDMPGMLLMVLNGRKILITLMAEMFEFARAKLIRPKVTTKKSS